MEGAIGPSKSSPSCFIVTSTTVLIVERSVPAWVRPGSPNPDGGPDGHGGGWDLVIVLGILGILVAAVSIAVLGVLVAAWSQ